MCGLVGIYSSNMLKKHKDALFELLYLDTWRGRDATGVAAIRSNADTQIMKSTVPGYEFLDNPRIDSFLKLNDLCWIGHNRYGTIGGNVRKNAHPFEVLDDDGDVLLVGAHNGTLKNKHVLKDHTNYGTDSEALFNEIAVSGLEETIKKVDGAWALSYFDHVEEELRLLRNKERPLHYAFEEEEHTFLWASEAWMLRIVCQRNNIKLKDDKVYMMQEDTLYRVPAPKKLNEVLVLHKKGGLVGKDPAFFHPERWGRTGGHAETQQKATEKAQQAAQEAREGQKLLTGTPTVCSTHNHKNGETPPSSNVVSSQKPSEQGSNVVDFLGIKKYKGYGGSLISTRELVSQLKDGCSWCEIEAIDPAERYGWLDEGKPVCVKCLIGVHDEFLSKEVSKTVH